MCIQVNQSTISFFFSVVMLDILRHSVICLLSTFVRCFTNFCFCFGSHVLLSHLASFWFRFISRDLYSDMLFLPANNVHYMENWWKSSPHIDTQNAMSLHMNAIIKVNPANHCSFYLNEYGKLNNVIFCVYSTIKSILLLLSQ